MTAEKVIKINSDYELKALNERLSVYESVIDYAVAEQMLSLKSKVKDLEDEAIALRATDAEKDKMITEKDNQLAYIRKNFDTQLNSRLEWQRKQFEAEKNQSLSDQRKNIRSREVKPEKEKVEQANNERDRVQKMYESLLGEFNQVNEKLDTQTGLLYTILDILNNSNSIDEAKDEIDELISNKKDDLEIHYDNNRRPSKNEKIAFTQLVNRLSESGMTNREIANKLYNEEHPFMTTVSTENAREQKVGRYLHKEY